MMHQHHSMRTTVDIDRHLLERLRDEAHHAGVSFKTILNRTLRRGLAAQRPDITRYECPTFSMGAPRRTVDKALALADALEDEEVERKLAQRE
jgi:hypothetical protein